MGLGRKVFTAGEILAAAEVQGFLMDQTIMVFADAAARTAAIGTAQPGMTTFRTDANVLEVFNGTAFVSANSVGGTVAGSQLVGNINATNVTNTLTSSTATAYTFAPADQSTTIRFTNAAVANTTIGTATALTAGQRIDILADGEEGLRVEAGAGVTLAGRGTVNATYELPQYEAATIFCVAANTYRIIGNVSVA